MINSIVAVEVLGKCMSSTGQGIFIDVGLKIKSILKGTHDS